MLGTSAVQSKLAGQGRPTAAPSPGSARGAMFARTDEALQAQASRGLAAALRQRGGVVQMRLTPESLGQLRVHLTMDQAQVSARFETSTAQARELLAGHASELRTALEARGLHVDSVQIVGPEPTAGTPGSMQDHPDQHSMAHDESSSAARERKNGASDRREPGPRDHDSRMDSLSAGGPTSAPALALDELGILRLDAIV